LSNSSFPTHHSTGTQTDYSLLSALEKDNCLLHEEVWKLRHESRVIKKNKKKIVFKSKNQSLEKARLQGQVFKQRGEMQVLKNETSALKKNIKELIEEKSELESLIHAALEEEEQAKRNMFGGSSKKKKQIADEPQTSAQRVHSHIKSALSRKQKKAKTKHGWPIRRRKVGLEW
jgi:hypothetical protein